MDQAGKGQTNQSNVDGLVTSKTDDAAEGIKEKSLGEAIDAPPSTTDGEIFFKLYKRRWLGIFLILFLNISSQINWLTFGPVAALVVEYYNIDYNALNWLSNVYAVTYVVISGAIGWSFDKFGIRWSLVVGALLNLLGAWLRYFAVFVTNNSSGRFALTMVGQFVAALAAPYFLNMPTKYVALWFGEKERAIGNMIGSSPIGLAIVMPLIPTLAPDVDHIPFALLVTSIISTVLFLPTLFVTSTPLIPPSIIASSPPLPFFTGLRQIANNINFWILLVVFSFYLGLSTAFSTLLNQFLTPYGYTNDQAGIVGLLWTLVGCLGAVVITPFFRRSAVMQISVKIMMSLLGVMYIVLLFVVHENNLPAIAAVSSVLGLLVIVPLALVLELGAECSYPTSPSISASACWGGGQLMGVIFTVIMTQLIYPSGSATFDPRPALVFQACVGAVSGIVIWAFRSKSLREMETQKVKEDTLMVEKERQDASSKV
ncbi:major facilitator superfamily domain-containing protein [Jimgerdemannia flammicorona]|uniref:Major facilitator superfamily domain-containing protein n=1 Tax=Jimgerdemannia flammicorona TaxID=994334 RepID=A0A433QXH9_9FUNG|nr:major facilitator superfamily domain-containing protein [Jimgerdemannia flammicorona]